jgi:hypothetical protein
MNKNTRNIVIVIVLIVIAFAAYKVLNAPDQRSGGEKLGDAIGKLDEGVDDAGRELEDRTPAERIKDDINDATDGSPE